MAAIDKDSKDRKFFAANWSLALVWLIALFTIAGAVIMYVTGDRFEAGVGLAALVIFLLFQIILPRAAKMSNPAMMRLVFSITMVSSLTAGRYLYLYDQISWYDKSQHLLYGIVIALVGLVFFYRMLPPEERRRPCLPASILWLYTTGFAMIFLFIWELFEFACDRIYGTNMQAWQDGEITGLLDTIYDQLIGFAGAIILSSLAAFLYSRDRTKFYRIWISGFFQ